MLGRNRTLLFAAALAALVSTPCRAGLSLDELLARHRALADATASGRYALVPSTLEPTVADGLTFAAGGPGDDVPPLLRPQARGDGGLQLRLHTSLFDGAVETRLGAAWWPGDSHPTTLDESSLSVAAGAGRFYASVERRHWGPAWTQSLILDGGARPVPAIGWRKTDPSAFATPWLSWIGPWNLDLFAGRLDQRSGPNHPYLLGGRLQFMPLSGLEIGVSRTIQWGGSGRPENLRSLWHALVGHDNYEADTLDDEPGNQLAGFDARYTFRFAGERTASFYLQGIGEDQAGIFPSRYLSSIGADTAFSAGGASLRLFLEGADTSIRGGFKTPLLGGAYRHHIYTDGYTQQGDPLGHPIGGDARLATLGVVVDRGDWSGTAMVHHGSAYRTSTLYNQSGGLNGADAEVAWHVDERSRIGVALYWWSDPQGSRTRGQLWWQLAFH